MFHLESVVPWGREYDEYNEMFGLDALPHPLSILGCGDGPASFNAEGTAQGLDIVSCDPLYRFSAEEIRNRIEEVRKEVLRQTRLDAEAFLWTRFRDVDHLGEVRLRAMNRFLEDYEPGRARGRYVEASLPALPFADDQFDLALCSHFLFLYSQQFDFDFHLAAVRELLRCAPKVRVFPVLQLGGEPSPYVDDLCDVLRSEGVSTALVETDYEFQRGGRHRLEISRPR